MIFFHDKDLKRIGKKYESGWNYTQRKNSEGSGKIDLSDYPTNARYASLYQGDKKFKDVLIEENSRSGSKISTAVKSLEALFSHYKIPENWHGWDKLPISYVLSDLVYGFETLRKSTPYEYSQYLEKYNIGISKFYDGDIHLDYTELNNEITLYHSGYITFAFDCGEAVSQRWARWVENEGEKVFIGVQSVAGDAPFTAQNLPNFTGVPILTARTGIEKEASLYGVKIASGKRYVAVRFNLWQNPNTATSTNTVYDAQNNLVTRTTHGLTPVLRALEVITRKTTEFTIYDAPTISTLVDLEFGDETLWDALKKLNEKYTFDFQTFISTGHVYFQYAASLVSDKTRKAEYMIHQGDSENRQLNNTTVKEIKTDNQKVNVLHCYGAGEYQEKLYVRVPLAGTSDNLSPIEEDFSDSSIKTLAELGTAGGLKLIELRGDNSPTFDVETNLPIRLFDKITIISPVTESVYDANVEEEEISYKGNKLARKFGVGGFRYNPIDSLVQKRPVNTENNTIKTPFGISAVSGNLFITLTWDGLADSYNIKWKDSIATEYNFRNSTEKTSVFSGLIQDHTYSFSVQAIKNGKVSAFTAEITVQPLPLPADGEDGIDGTNGTNGADGSNGNLCFNSDFRKGIEGWFFSNSMASTVFSTDIAPDWTILGGHTAFIQQESAVTTGYSEIYSPMVPATPGQTWEYQARTGAHRCRVDVFMYWINAAGAAFANTPLSGNDEEYSGGTLISLYKLNGGFGIAPAGTVKAMLVLRKNATKAPYTNSYLFATQAKLSLARAGQTVLSAWNPDTPAIPKYLGTTQTVTTTPTVLIVKGPQAGYVDAIPGDYVLMTAANDPVVWRQGYIRRWTGSAWVELTDQLAFKEAYNAALADILSISGYTAPTGSFGMLMASSILALQATIAELRTDIMTLSAGTAQKHGKIVTSNFDATHGFELDAFTGEINARQGRFSGGLGIIYDKVWDTTTPYSVYFVPPFYGMGLLFFGRVINMYGGTTVEDIQAAAVFSFRKASWPLNPDVLTISALHGGVTMTKLSSPGTGMTYSPLVDGETITGGSLAIIRCMRI